jgi:hypothetical protein
LATWVVSQFIAVFSLGVQSGAGPR